MYSKSIFLILCSLVILLASTANGRNGPREYWNEIMKEQPMPEAMKALVNMGPIEAQDNKFNDDFEPRPNLSVYNDADTNKLNSKGKDCNTHQNGPEPKKPFMDDFLPRPNISVYND